MNSNLLYNYFVSTHQGLVRANNEDNYGDTATSFGHVYIVCDGMGGHAAGEKASQIAVETIADSLKNCEDENHRENLKNAIIAANTAILEAVEQDISLKGMGTTCVVLYLFNNGQILLAHVGDSRIYEYYNHSLKRVTKDHSYVQFLVDSGEITPEEAENHKSKNQILRALGADDTVKPEVSDFINPDSKTCYILCSDGLSDMINDTAIENVLNNYSTISLETVEHLVSEALNAGGKDNVTVGLLEIVKNRNTTAQITSTLQNFRANTKQQPNFKTLLLAGVFAIALVALAFLFLNKSKDNTSDAKNTGQKTEIEKPESQPLKPDSAAVEITVPDSSLIKTDTTKAD